MKRNAALDFLRGSAAFAVAIPHYLTTNAPFQPLAEATAIAGVEVFFVLSGFVLAPQIVGSVIGKPRRNLGVFLARRWMRTIPPYVVALVAVALLTGNLLTRDCLRYLFYVENLFTFANHTDFYPVAWSLAVEEWFYLLFAPIMFAVGWLLARRDRRMEAAFAVLFILAVAGLRLSFAPGDWDLNVRRVTMFRIDSIVWGFLLYLAFERWAPRAPSRLAGRRLLVAVVALLAGSIALELWLAAAALGGGAAAREAFPYASALFGMILVGVFALADGAFGGSLVRRFSFFIGRISYSVYLFHIIVVMALKPKIASWPLAAQLAVYCLVICSFSTLFWSGFERPILAARPDYRRRPPALAPTPLPHSPSTDGRSSKRPLASDEGQPPKGTRRFRPSWATLALGLAVLGAGALARGAFMANRAYAFYALMVATAALALALADRARPPLARVSGTAARALLLFALALPIADFAFRTSTGLPLAASAAQPTYSYKAAHKNPTAFAMWWFYYLNEWIRDDGIRRSIEMPDPEKKLPFVMIPGASGRMFNTTIKINNLGFRGPDLGRDKGDAYRIFALGESQTFGPTLRDGEKPWPELLQDLFDQHASCGRKIEVVNAGTEAYTLEDNLERMRRDILPLKPDLILSTHGMNGLLALGLRRQFETNEPGIRPRASPLIGRAVLTVERAVYDWRVGRGPRPPPAVLKPFSDDELLRSRYAQDYRKLIALARDNGVGIVLSTSAMAVNAKSPREVKDFYGAVFKPIDDIIAANAAHNRMVRLLGREQGVPVIDMAKGVDGLWDDDLYLDIVHFTERGNERTAKLMFKALLPILEGRGVRCAIH